MVFNTLVNGQLVAKLNTVKESKSGQMVRDSKAGSSITKPTDLVESFIQMVTSTLENSLTIKLMDKEPITNMRMVRNTKVLGSTIKCLEKALKHGQMAISMTENI